MGAPLEFCSKRGVVAVLATGVVISLTALTGGLAPAIAQPGDDSGVTTTVVAPEPEVSAPEPVEEAPQAPAEAPAPVVPQAPQTQAPQTQAPQTQAPAEVESTPEPQAPVTTMPPVTTVAPAEPSEEDVTTASQAPITPAPGTSTPESSAEATTAAESPESSTAATTATSPSEAAESSASTSTPSSEAAESSTETSGTTSPSETSTSESAETTASETSSDESETPTVSIEQTAKEIETVEPQQLDAPVEDVQLASKAAPVDEKIPAPAPEPELASFSSEISTSLKLPGLDVNTSATTNFAVDPPVELISPVRQWRPDWVQYDEYYRPIILNPYRNPVRIVYMYEMTPRIMVVPPLGRMVFEAAQYAAYSFTAALLAPVVAAANVAQAVSNIAVGSFFGGGYYPGVGMPPPPPPPPVMRYDNVPVFVNYSNARYEPFRVNRIVDVGDDPQFGERKVLLDGVTPAWGVWNQSPTGERQFEVHRTQQFPGLEAPAEGPLPGDYRLRLASDDTSTGGLSGRDIFLMVSAGVIGTLGFGAIGLAWFLGRRRNQGI
ncbi:hypothetical protein [Mycolicibacterium gadium]|uniref:hypothetical protein n=1 Tax=Mycolicibacterium gadium TaxID=1794 RepID=UPI002FDCCD45